ncbi:MAG TPA: carboxypeptidase regulatory-like domain-containing protein [Pyrinomonadaceae bacterium]|nr:carboxypeptidase regulatory-like domain-containing protein [Pyrinomonadaceae bacterium]
MKGSGIWLAALSCALLALSAYAQTASTQEAQRTVEVKGTVFDSHDAAVVGAKVIFESNGERHEATTDSGGGFGFELPRGTYEVAAGADGFCAFHRSQFRVEPGIAAQSFNINLRIGAIADVLIPIKGGNYIAEGMAVDAAGQPCGLNPPATPSVENVSLQRGHARRSGATTTPSGRVLNVSTQPAAIVWVDEVRRGTTDAGGKLQLKLTPGRHTLRVRANGFAERTLALLPTQRGAFSVVLTKTNDGAELAFQQAEDARDKGNAQQAVELYRQALKLRPHFAAAHLGLARALESGEDFDGALEEVRAARSERPVYAEASAVEGRLLRSQADTDGALAAYQRALREARGFQPEAYTGMGIVYEDKGRYEEAVASFRKAIAQLSDTEPVLYELLGRDLEKLERWKEAVAAYEKYLALAPTGAHASAINSIIDQLRKQAAEAEQQQTPPD